VGIRGARGLAGVGALVTVAGVGYSVAAMAGSEAAWGSWAQTVLHLGELAVVVALAGLGALGVLGWVGWVLAVLGQLVLAVAEVVFVSAPGLGDVMFGIGPLLSGAGMICVGIVVSRTAVLRWRVLPLLVGIWILVPTTPVLIATGGPPNVIALAAIAVWDVLWAATAIAILAATAAALHARTGNERLRQPGEGHASSSTNLAR
jgi:hypothetical protein